MHVVGSGLSSLSFALPCLDRSVGTVFSSFLLFWKRIIIMIQSPNFVHLSNVADLKSAFTVEALKLFLVVFLINANFFFLFEHGKKLNGEKKQYMLRSVLILFVMSLSLFCMLAEYMILYLSQFELLVQKGRFSPLLICLLSYCAGLIMLIGLNCVKSPMFSLKLYS